MLDDPARMLWQGWQAASPAAQCAPDLCLHATASRCSLLRGICRPADKNSFSQPAPAAGSALMASSDRGLALSAVSDSGSTLAALSDLSPALTPVSGLQHDSLPALARPAGAAQQEGSPQPCLSTCGAAEQPPQLLPGRQQLPRQHPAQRGICERSHGRRLPRCPLPAGWEQSSEWLARGLGPATACQLVNRVFCRCQLAARCHGHRTVHSLSWCGHARLLRIPRQAARTANRLQWHPA